MKKLIALFLALSACNNTPVDTTTAADIEASYHYLDAAQGIYHGDNCNWSRNHVMCVKKEGIVTTTYYYDFRNDRSDKFVTYNFPEEIITP